MNCSNETAHSIRGQIRNCLTLLSKYQWLHDSLVHDFFVDNHWSSLPPSWRIVLAEMSQEQLANFLSGQSNSGRNKKKPGYLLPTALYCKRSALKTDFLMNRYVDASRAFVFASSSFKAVSHSTACQGDSRCLRTGQDCCQGQQHQREPDVRPVAELSRGVESSRRPAQKPAQSFPTAREAEEAA